MDISLVFVTGIYTDARWLTEQELDEAIDDAASAELQQAALQPTAEYPRTPPGRLM